MQKLPRTDDIPAHRIRGGPGRWSARLGLIGAVLAWLWPIGAGGRMPVGGDVTQFSVGLMATLGRSLRAGRWPLWNDLWGFGFPGLAESQIGLYYPAHLLYGIVSTETAYTAILVAHFLGGATGAAWFARRLGVSEAGAALAGFAWIGSGFFLIHLPHQWAYTVGAWMPWAWGLAWRAVRLDDPRAARRSAWLLAAVLAVQLLPGHFQMAFITEVGALILAVLGSGRGRWGRLGSVGLAVASAFLLAAAQVIPTLALARLAGASRDFEYLSGFAVAPVHLVSFVAPGLFHRSPLWRPLAWDVFHTAPEEYLGYVGLVPLFLAGVAVARSVRTSVEVRALLGVALATLALSLGPYCPGFRLLIGLPGFSFFRAPGRWNLATCLALAALAGRGFDLARGSGWSRRGVLAFASGATLAVGFVVGGFELALVAGRFPGWPAVASWYDAALRALPWSGPPGAPTDFRATMLAAHRPQDDLRVRAAQARLFGTPPPPGGWLLALERGDIYARELEGSALTLVAFTAIGLTLGRRPRALAWALGALVLADLIAQGRARPFDLGPIRPLVDQSPVLRRVAARPPGARTIDPAQNLFQVAGGNPATAYRTLTLPAPDAWLRDARDLDPSGRARAASALRALGVDARVFDPFEVAAGRADGLRNAWGRPAEVIRDPALAGWLYGADFARLDRAEVFAWVDAARTPARAWRFDAAGFRQASAPGGLILSPDSGLYAFDRARPLPYRALGPEHVEVDCQVDGTADAADWIVVSTTYDPLWRGDWVDAKGVTRPAKVERGPGGFLSVPVGVPAWPGLRTLRLNYSRGPAWLGVLASAVGWSAWLGLGGWTRWNNRKAGRATGAGATAPAPARADEREAGR